MARWKRVVRWCLVLPLAACGDSRPSSGLAFPAGTIEGRVVVRGELPGPTRVSNSTDPEVCGRDHTLDDLVVSSDGGLRWAIVSLSDVSGAAAPEPGVLEIDNRDCRFVPHAAVATVGSTLEAVNADPLLHTTHLYGPADVNISLPLRGARATRRLDAPGLYVVKCDIHGWMQAFVRVDPHPFHAVTGADGRFRIAGVPVGRHTLEVWHEKLGAREVSVDVRAGVSSPVTVDFALDARSRGGAF